MNCFSCFRLSSSHGPSSNQKPSPPKPVSTHKPETTINSKETFNRALQHRVELADAYVHAIKQINKRTRKCEWYQHGPTFYFKRSQKIEKEIHAMDKTLKSLNHLYNNGKELELDSIETLKNRAGVYNLHSINSPSNRL